MATIALAEVRFGAGGPPPLPVPDPSSADQPVASDRARGRRPAGGPNMPRVAEAKLRRCRPSPRPSIDGTGRDAPRSDPRATPGRWGLQYLGGSWKSWAGRVAGVLGRLGERSAGFGSRDRRPGQSSHVASAGQPPLAPPLRAGDRRQRRRLRRHGAGFPADPELLDFLAARFVASGWSTKAMHRVDGPPRGPTAMSSAPDAGGGPASIPSNLLRPPAEAWAGSTPSRFATRSSLVSGRLDLDPSAARACRRT